MQQTFLVGLRGILQLIAIYLIAFHNILGYMQIVIIKTEAADFVKINIYTQNFWPSLYTYVSPEKEHFHHLTVPEVGYFFALLKPF